ncbi:MAG: hypothetical protein ACF8TS_01675 [Maioricimonas sp. JB049]
MRRLILLGASNVTIAFPLIVASLRASFGEPIELIAAHGHGRSFGKTSRVLWRDLPGISVCRMWSELERRPPSPHPPMALMTDIGNDLLYGVRPPQLLEWVETCLKRLQDAGTELAIALPPRDSVLQISAARYYATRAIFFPGGGPTWAAMQQMFHDVDAGLVELANRYGAAAVRPQREWYGLDPIHIRRSARRAAWATILSGWPSAPAIQSIGAPLREGLNYWRLGPADRWLFGRPQQRPQPAAVLSCGTTISLF